MENLYEFYQRKTSFCLRKSWPDKWTQLAASSWSCDLTMTGNFQCRLFEAVWQNMCTLIMVMVPYPGREVFRTMLKSKSNNNFFVYVEHNISYLLSDSLTVWYNEDPGTVFINRNVDFYIVKMPAIFRVETWKIGACFEC